jgi:hypothetical protein
MFIVIFLLAMNVFSQNNLEQFDIIQNNFIEIVNSYNENKHLINNDQLNEIIETIDLFFNKNNEQINYNHENNKIIFARENVCMEITTYFYLSRNTSSFTYCGGNIIINNLSYSFFLYDRSYSSNYYEIINNENLTFRYCDLNGDRYAFINNFNPYCDELFVIRQYNRNEVSTEILPINMEIVYKKLQ